MVEKQNIFKFTRFAIMTDPVFISGLNYKLILILAILHKNLSNTIVG